MSSCQSKSDNKVLILYHRDAKKLYEDGIHYATSGSVGLDLRACIEDESISIEAQQRIAIPTGISIEILKEDTAGFVYSRSGLGAKTGLTVAQGVGVIDYDYRGEIIVYLLNTSDKAHTITKGDRIAQLVFQEAYRLQPQEATSLSTSQRGVHGFGHTGK